MGYILYCTSHRIFYCKYVDNIEILEAFYLFLTSWYSYKATYYEIVLPKGGRWILLDGLAKEQLSSRNLNAGKYFEEFKNVLDSFKVKSEEVNLLIRIIEKKYSEQLGKLLRKRLVKLAKEDLDLIELFSAYLFYVEEGHGHLDYEIFDKLKAILRESFGKLYQNLINSGLVIIHGYRSITSRGEVVDHIGVLIPPWSFEYLKEVFGRYLAKQETEIRRIISELEEKRVCPICEELVKDDEFTTLFGFKVHYSKCYEIWRKRKQQLLPLLPETFTDIERELIAGFQALNVIKGDYLYEELVSSEEKLHPYIGMKRIDLVVRTGKVDWIIEVERELNYTAIGQVLVYSILWNIIHPGGRIVRGIVTKSAPDKDILNSARILGIKVFSEI